MSKIVARNRKSIWRGAARDSEANSPPVLGRLLGLETEYGLLFHCPEDSAHHAEDLSWYPQVIENLASKIPLANSRTDRNEFFMANGGSVSLERSTAAPTRNGLLEGATPECYSPRTLLIYQAAQDQLLRESVERSFHLGDVRLVKNSADAQGNIYGQQENYEVEVAQGWRRFAWRIGLILLLPIVLLYKVLAALWLGSIFSFSFLVHEARRWMYLVGRKFHGRRGRTIDRHNPSMKTRRPSSSAPDDSSKTSYSSSLDQTPHGNGDDAGLEDWYEDWSDDRWLSERWVLIGSQGLRLLHMPLALSLLGLIRFCALVPHRQRMAAFLASRCVLEGSGWIDPPGRYWLSVKAASTTALIGFGRYWSSRPVFDVGHWLRGICTDRWYSLRGYFRLFRKRQRLQLNLGDATPNPISEYLRIGTTALVIDMCECERASDVPKLSRPIEAIRRLASDWMLLAKVTDRKKVSWNAIEIQRQYLQAVRKFLQRHWQVPNEAWEILQQWEATIENLTQSRHDPDSHHWLLGRVDWFSKKWLMDQVTGDADWHIRKKVDLRYHELSEDGYLKKLHDALHMAPMVAREVIERAMRNPPEGTPAMKRGYLIREFADSEEYLRVDWESVEIGIGAERRLVSLRKPR